MNDWLEVNAAEINPELIEKSTEPMLKFRFLHMMSPGAIAATKTRKKNFTSLNLSI